MGSEFTRIDGPTPQPSPTGRTDGVFTGVLPSGPIANEDAVLIAFEFGDMHHDADGRDFLAWQKQYQLDVDVAMEAITIVHEGFELM